MNEQLTYELGLQEGLKMIEMWKDGRFYAFLEIIENYILLREPDELSEYECGVLDAWKEKYAETSNENE